MADGLERHIEASPTSSAEMTITLGPPPSWRAAVPSEQAHHLITTMGIVVSVCGGIGGAVYTLHNASLGALGLAEMGTGLLGAILVAGCSLVRTRHEGRAVRDQPAQLGDGSGNRESSA